MLLRAKLLLRREGGDAGCDGSVFHVLVKATAWQLNRPVSLTRSALEVVRKQGGASASEDISAMLRALENSGDGRARAIDAGLAKGCEFSEGCKLSVGDPMQLPSRDPASRVVYGSARLCVQDALIESGLPVVHVQHALGGGVALSLCAIFVKAPANATVAQHADSVMHFVRRGAGPCVSVQALRLGRRSSSCILRKPFQSNFESREQLSEAHAAEMRNLGLACGAVRHAITPLWTASQSVAEHGGEQVRFLSIRI